MSSGAQLNRWGTGGGVPLLNLTASATAVSSPLTAYGTLGVNDSGAFVTPIGLQTYTFQIIQPPLGTPAPTGAVAPTGYEVTIFGTIDPIAYQAYELNGGSDAFTSVTGTNGPLYAVTLAVPATSWAPLPGPSEQTGTGTSANPMTATGMFFQAKIALVAVRAVLTAVNSAAGNAIVYGFAVP